MKKAFTGMAFGAALVVAATTATAQAGGGPNGTYVHFEQAGSYDCQTFWKTTGSGLIHEWRYDESCAPFAGEVGLHLVFKPASKFSSADCDADALGSAAFTWTGAGYTDLSDDEADLGDFLALNATYYVCFYPWGDQEVTA